jgi:hypothetical protein
MDTHRQHGDLVSLLSLLLKKENMLENVSQQNIISVENIYVPADYISSTNV